MSGLVQSPILLPLLTVLALGATQIHAAGSSEAEDCLSLPDCASMGEESAEAESTVEEAGFDWEPYAKKMLKEIRWNWNPPEAARKGTPGQAKVRFYIEPGGELACIDIMGFEGPPEFAAAAQAAVCKSAPFKPFPRAIESSRPEGTTITFYYNMKNKQGKLAFGRSNED